MKTWRNCTYETDRIGSDAKNVTVGKSNRDERFRKCALFGLCGNFFSINKDDLSIVLSGLYGNPTLCGAVKIRNVSEEVCEFVTRSAKLFVSWSFCVTIYLHRVLILILNTCTRMRST